MRLDEVERRIAGSKTVVIDCETNSLNWKTGHTVGFALGFGPMDADTAYLPIRHESDNLDPRQVIGAIKAGLKANPGVRYVNHNAAFDLHFLDNDGIHHSLFGALECSMVTACLIDERQRSFSLAACCEFAGVAAKKGDELYRHLSGNFGGEPGRAQMQNFWRLAGDDPLAVEYARGDALSTYQLHLAQQKEIAAQDLYQAHAIENRVVRVLHRMTSRGVKIDEERLHQVIKLVRAKQIEAEAKLPKDFNVKAPTQMMKLFSDAGITDWPKTEKGNPSFTAEWLETTDVGKRVVAVRKLRHLDNSFLTPMLERHIHKGRVHTTYNQTRGEEFGTITYRLSSNEPNKQQSHKRDVLLGSLVRSIDIPDDGMTMGTADYRQIEPCLLAHYGRVKALLDGYLADPPIDAHSAVAQSVFGPSFTPDDREKAKRINQAILTGAGKAKIALMVGGEKRAAEKLVDDYFASMPEIKTVQRRSADVLQQRGYVRCLLGHRARLEDSRFAYKALNRLLQVGNAGIIKLAMANIDEYYASEGDRVHLLQSIHDDLVTQWHPDDRKIYNEGLRIMEDFGPSKTTHVDVPIRVDAKEGKNWAEATYGVDKVRASWTKMGGRYD